MPQVNITKLDPYLDAGMVLIPLYPYTAITSAVHGGKRKAKAGKRPLHSNWTTRHYDSEDTIALAESDNCNVGVRLEQTHLVIDVDPRNGGNGGLKKLRRRFPALSAILDTAPCVRTGGDGLHYYLTKPADVVVIDTLPDFPGVEFKSRGRQVVAAGSIHPDTCKLYRWDTSPERVPLEDAPEIPDDFAEAITRPVREYTGEGGGQYTGADMAKMLSGLDPEDYRTNDQWQKLMMAVHHATAGEARDEFIAWSTSDPEYADDGDIIGRRWDSLHTERDGAITFATLRKELYAKGRAHLIPPAIDGAANDFADDDFDFDTDDGSASKPTATATKSKRSNAAADFDDDDDGIEPAEPPSVLHEINAEYCAVMEGGKFRIMRQVHDPMLDRRAWERIGLQDFNAFFANRRVERADDGGSRSKTIAASQAWMEWGGRRTYDRVVFNPEMPQEEHGVLNLWTGWGVEPSPSGSWDMLQEMLLRCLCDDDSELFEYVLNWSAYMFQHPAQPAESCIVFRGDQGIGKGTFGRALLKLCGRHGVHVQSPDHITGRFNSHLRDCVFLFSDEAIKPYDKTAEAKLRALVTEPTIQIEGKGVDIVTVPNVIHVMMASNEKWVLPVGSNERRYVVANASNRWLGKAEKWKALGAELEAGGHRRMLYDLLRRPLGDFHPRQIIRTEALSQQQLQSMSPVQTYLFNAAFDGVWPGNTTAPAPDWSREPIRVFTDDFVEDFTTWARRQNINPGANGRANKADMYQRIKEVFPTARQVRERVPDDSSVRASPSDGRAWAYELPPLSECRDAFDRTLRTPQQWPVDGDDFDFG